MSPAIRPAALSRQLVAPQPLVSLADAKAWLMVEHGEHDALITAIIAAAVDHVDGAGGVLGLALLRQQWQFTFDAFPEADGKLRLPLAPLTVGLPLDHQPLLKVEWRNAAQAWQEADMMALEDGTSPYAIPPGGSVWPSPPILPGSVRVTAWFGENDAARVSPAILAAIRLIVGDLYANRETTALRAEAIPSYTTVERLLDPHRRWWR
jgi:uncharacterized phiE125 gp8 family phage protein